MNGLLLAFVAADGLGAILVFGLLGLDWLGYAAAAAAVLVTLAAFFREGVSDRVRLAALAVLLGLLFLLPQAVLVAKQPPNAAVIDGVLLNDAAADRLLAGRDPYVGDFLHTGMRAFYLSDVPVNFGLARFVYMPGMPLLDLPIRALRSDRANFSWLFLPGLVALAAAAWSTGRSRRGSEAALVAVTLNPLFQLDYLYLLNDLFFLAPALAGVGMLRRGRPAAAGAWFGLALAMKQQAVLFLPLVLIYAWFNLDRRAWLRLAAGGAAVLAVVVLPFLLWNPAAFVAGTAGFFYGSGVDSYPIRGIGLQGLLLRAGVIGNRWAPFPSAQLQVPLLLVLLGAAAARARRRWSWIWFWLWLAGEGVVLFAFGRVLSPNYLDLVVTFLLLAAASALVGEGPAEAVGRVVERTDGDGREVAARGGHDPGHLPAV